VPNIGTSGNRNAETDTSAVRSVDIRYTDISEGRSADLGNLDTRKSTTVLLVTADSIISYCQ